MAGQVFYPSLVCNFQIRFDEAFHVSEQPAPVSSEALARGQGGATTQPRPPVRPLFSQGAKDSLSIVLNRIPRTATVELTGFRQAATFRLSIDYRDLPVDPRLVRSCAVAIHLDAVAADAYGRGMVSVQGDGGRSSVLTPTPDNLVLAGLVDGWHVAHSESTSSIDMYGRDLRGIFLDSPLPADIFKSLKIDQPIDEVVKQILNKHPRAGEMKIAVQPQDWTDSGAFGPSFLPSLVPSVGPKDKLDRHRRGASGDRAVLTPPGPVDQLNFWDLITRYCFLVGAVPFFVGSTLVIRPARSIFDQQKTGTAPGAGSTPFKDGRQRQAPGVLPFSVRKLAYGRDVADMSFERKYTGFKARTVRCVSVDTSSTSRGRGKRLEVDYPSREELKKIIAERLGGSPEAVKQADKAVKAAMAKAQGSKATSVSPSGRETEQEILTVPVPGIRDKDRLRAIAKDIYEEVGRGEMGGSVKTRNLASFGGDNTDPDLLRLRPGDGVELVVDSRPLSSSGPLVSFLIDSIRQPFEERVREVQSRFGRGTPLGDENIARAVVAAAQGSIVELQKFFRVMNVRFDWSARGVDIAFDYQNYVVARSETTPSTGASTAPPTTRVSTGKKQVA